MTIFGPGGDWDPRSHEGQEHTPTALTADSSFRPRPTSGAPTASRWLSGDGSRGGAWGTNSLGVVIGNGSDAFSYGGHTDPPDQHPIYGHNSFSITVANGAEARAVGNGRRSTAFTPGRQLNNGLNQ